VAEAWNQLPKQRSTLQTSGLLPIPIQPWYVQSEQSKNITQSKQPIYKPDLFHIANVDAKVGKVFG